METLDENASVISARKVTGTNVYNTEGSCWARSTT